MQMAKGFTENGQPLRVFRKNNENASAEAFAAADVPILLRRTLI